MATGSKDLAKFQRNLSREREKVNTKMKSFRFEVGFQPTTNWMKLVFKCYKSVTLN